MCEIMSQMQMEMICVATRASRKTHYSVASRPESPKQSMMLFRLISVFFFSSKTLIRIVLISLVHFTVFIGAVHIHKVHFHTNWTIITPSVLTLLASNVDIILERPTENVWTWNDQVHPVVWFWLTNVAGENYKGWWVARYGHRWNVRSVCQGISHYFSSS